MGWDSNMVVTAKGLHKNYSTSNFMYPFIVTMHCMSVIKPLSIKSYNTEQMTLHSYMHTLKIQLNNWKLFILMTVCFMIGMCKLKL